MPTITVTYGEEIKAVTTETGSLLGDVIAHTGLPLEQPCAGRGTCGKCKVLAEGDLAPPDEVEYENLTPGELAVGNRLACRARVAGDVQISLAPIVVYSNKMFKASTRYKRERDVPLGLAIDFGSTTVAAFLTMLDNGEVCAGGAALNQMTVYGADVISRLAAAMNDPAAAERLHKLAVASINQAVDSLKLSARIRNRINRVTVVCNVAMHHLLARLPVKSLAMLPFQPHSKAAILDASALTEGIFPETAQVTLPPMIGGFVGSDALACLVYFGFDNPSGPMAAIDLGTNGEVMVTDGERILTASTAAGPAFEGVNISCGTRAVDGAITAIAFEDDGDVSLQTIGDLPPVGLTGSGLLSAVHQMRKVGLLEESGRISHEPPCCAERVINGTKGGRRINLTEDGELSLTQRDVRELQKALGAIRASVDVLMDQLGLKPADLQRVILTGSFGGQMNLDAVLSLGMIPPVPRDRVEAIANGAGYGAAMLLSDEGFALGQKIATKAEQINLDANQEFINRYVAAMSLSSTPAT